MEQVPNTIYLKDYKAPFFDIKNTHLSFDLDETKTLVSSILEFIKLDKDQSDCVLDGEDLVLKSILINDKKLSEDEFEIKDDKLTLFNVPEKFTLKIQNTINPKANTTLNGLYLSSGMLTTQCESHGFRSITYFLDRPDVLSSFKVTIRADKIKYPVLLSNGNLISQKSLDNNIHEVTWHDPFKKPAYLFALVAGDLEVVEDTFTTKSNRKVVIKLYSDKDSITDCTHAVESLKKAMHFDETTYHREYDLDIYMIVVAQDFNMGAMENKGLNIFNTSCVLFSENDSTDYDYHRVESVIGHEYFHNWSGNRVTCRDWFQLSLKEGLTVFREQEFMRSSHSPTISRIEDVTILRTNQFTEDASPLAHSVQPDYYMEVNNFYTATIYEKGSELIRMIQTLIGKDAFIKGLDLYFNRYDGSSATIDSLLSCLSEVSNRDLTQFKLWYKTPGTPEVSVTSNYNEKDKVLTLNLTQSNEKAIDKDKALHIPIRLSLFTTDGGKLSPTFNNASSDELLLELTKHKQTFTLENVGEVPVLSLLRDFSAPVHLSYDSSEDDLKCLLLHDDDGFNQYEASQQLYFLMIKRLLESSQTNENIELESHFYDVFESILNLNVKDKHLKALLLGLPSELQCVREFKHHSLDSIIKTRDTVQKALSSHFFDRLVSEYEKNLTGDYSHAFESKAIAQRALKNTLLSYIMKTPRDEALKLCLFQFENATNMTDEIGALSALSHHDIKGKDQALESFYHKYQHKPLVVDKWFRIQAHAKLDGTLESVKSLTRHPAFTYENPNKIRALIGAYAQNLGQFHLPSGAGYEFFVHEVSKVDGLNPQTAARLLQPLTRWQLLDDNRANLMKSALGTLLNKDDLSKDVYEIVTKSLP